MEKKLKKNASNIGPIRSASDQNHFLDWLGFDSNQTIQLSRLRGLSSLPITIIKPLFKENNGKINFKNYRIDWTYCSISILDFKIILREV